MVSGNNKTLFLQSLGLSVALAAFCHSAVSAQSHGASSTTTTTTSSSPAAHVSLPDIAALKAKVEAEPSDPKVRYAYAEGLRKHGRGKEASHEYLTVTELEPSFYHAYHQLSVVNHDKHVLDEAISLFLEGEPNTAKLILRDLVNATVGFESLAEEIHKPAKSLHRMLSASGNPTMNNLSAIFAAITRALKVEVHTHVVAA